MSQWELRPIYSTKPTTGEVEKVGFAFLGEGEDETPSKPQQPWRLYFEQALWVYITIDQMIVLTTAKVVAIGSTSWIRGPCCS